MLYPSLHIATLFIYHLFRSRNCECDCGCGQNCQQDCGNNPISVGTFCQNCFDCESCKGGCITCPPPSLPPPPHRPPPSPPVTHKNKHTKIIAGAVAVSVTACVSAPLIALAFFVPPLPSFALPGISVISFDLSTPNVISANFQVAISSHNSNSLIRFYFDRLRIYVTYRNQQITNSTPLPPNHEGHNQTDAWTANVCGTLVILEPTNAVALCQEQATGSVSVTVRIVGRVRWKFWFFPSVKHRFSVKCLASISIGTQQPQITARKCSVRL